MLSIRRQGSPKPALSTATYLVLNKLNSCAKKCHVAVVPDNRSMKSECKAITVGINSTFLQSALTVLTGYVCNTNTVQEKVFLINMLASQQALQPK